MGRKETTPPFVKSVVGVVEPSGVDDLLWAGLVIYEGGDVSWDMSPLLSPVPVTVTTKRNVLHLPGDQLKRD